MKSIRIDTHDTERGEVTTYELINASGASVKLSSLGAGILEIKVPDSGGKLADVVLGYKNVADYFYDGPCAGKVPAVMPTASARVTLRSTAKPIS